MDADHAKDRAEDTAVAVLEAAASMIPFVGGPASVLVNRSFGSAVQRRNDRIFAKIESDVQELLHRMNLADSDAVLNSEEFMAAVHRVFRASQETTSDEKREALRNALLNGYVGPGFRGQRDEFLTLVTRYEPGHVVVLGAIQSLMADRTHLLDHTEQVVRTYLDSGGKNVPVGGYLHDLVRDGLASEASESEVKEQNQPRRAYMPRETKQVTVTTRWHGISVRGKAFLEFVSNPASPGHTN